MKKLKILWSQLVCLLLGHRDVTVTHYLPGRGALTLTRCERCPRRHSPLYTRAKQFPLPKVRA